MIRPAVVEDASRIAEIHVRVWQTAYAGIMPDEFLRELTVEPRAAFWRETLNPKGTARSRVLVWETTVGVTGWVSFGDCRDDDLADAGEIYAIYVLAEHAGKGVGQLLLREAEAQFRAVHKAEVTLWVLAQNLRAKRFYDRAGYSADGETKTVSIAGSAFAEERFRKRL